MPTYDIEANCPLCDKQTKQSHIIEEAQGVRFIDLVTCAECGEVIPPEKR